MIEKHIGWLRDLYPDPLGSALVEDAAVGATTLAVNDAVHFDESGGTLRLNGTLIGYAGVDMDADVIELNGPLVEAADADDLAEVWDTDNGTPAADLVAEVELLNVNGDDDPVSAKLTHALSNMLPTGPRDGRGERVWVEQDGNNWTVVDLIGKQAILDLSGADPDSLGGAKPKAPENLVLSSAIFVAAGRTRARITADWDPVTQDTDDEDLDEDDLSRYEVQYQTGNGSGGMWQAFATTSPDTTQATVSPFDVGVQHALRVRAVRGGDTVETVSDWSVVATIVTAADGTAPDKPSTPGATNRLGMHTITWDGKDWLGNPMPADFAYAELHRSTSNGFTATPGDLSTVVYRFGGAGKFNLPGTYNVTDYFVLIAFDTSGNASAQSSQATSITKPLVDVSNFPDTAMDELYARTGHFIDLTADNFLVNKVQADWCDIGLLTAMLVRGAQMETHAGTFRGVKINDDGIKAYDSSGTNPTPTFQVDAVTGSVTARGVFRTAEDGQRIVISSDGTITAYDSANNPSKIWFGTTGRVRVDHGMTIDGSFNCQGFTSSGASSVSSGGLSVTGQLTIFGGADISGRTELTGVLDLNNNDAVGFASLTLNGPVDTNGGNVTTDGGDLNLGGGNVNNAGSVNGSAIFSAESVASPATGPVNGNVTTAEGRIRRTTSSAARYKENIEPAELDVEALLQLEPKRFDYRQDYCPDALPQIGFIADEADAIEGLDFWVWRENGEIETFDYMKWVVALQAIARHQDAQSVALEKRVEALEAQVA